MARLNENFDNDENYPGLPVIPHTTPRSPLKNTRTTLEENQAITNGQKSHNTSTEEELQIPLLEPASPITRGCSDKQTPLYMNILALPTRTDAIQSEYRLSYLYGPTHVKPRGFTPKMYVTPPANRINSASEWLHKGSAILEGRQATQSLSNYVVIDSTSETDHDTRGYSFQQTQREAYKPRDQTLPEMQLHGTDSSLSGKSGRNFPSTTANTVRSSKPVRDILVAGCSPSKANIGPESRVPEPGSAKEDDVLFRYSPSTSKSQRKYEGASSRAMSQNIPPIYPVASTSKAQSTPNPCYTPIFSGFQNQEVSNQLNPESSPRKAQTLIKAKGLASNSEPFELTKPSPSVILQDFLPKGFVERDSEKTQQKTAFDKKKYSLAALFLKDIDLKINNGQLEALAASTGGINLIWSKKLTSTAGRANWRRENVRSLNPREDISTEYRHHASIELAEKIIDGEDRLFNVIAHEYCHLANFMISGVKNNPHGKEFREWARKVTLAFSYLSIKVTTTHNYTISYKYIWTCASTSCGLEYKRHSRSIDPTRHSCGNCSGRLIQTKPLPRMSKRERAEQGGTGEGEVCQKRGKYQEYVKMNFAAVRSENPGLGMAGWMVELGRRFREHNAREVAQAGSLRNISAIGQRIAYSWEDVNERVVKERPSEAEGINPVMMKLDLLSIK